MTQQTAVEWLIDKIAEKSIIEKDRYYIPYNSGTIDITDLIEQAKQTEKEQIVKAAKVILYRSTGQGDTAAEQYYNETYGK